MKIKKILIILILIILVFAVIVHNNSDTNIILLDLLKKGEIKSGELKYKIDLFAFIPVAEAVFAKEGIESYKDQKVYHLSATANSLKALSKFFSGSVVLDSYIDIKQLNPLLFKQKIIIKDRPDIEKEVVYDQKKNTMIIAGVSRQILPDTQDALSALYNLRRMDFDKKKEIEMNINTNQKNYILKGTARQENILVSRKNYRVVKIEAEIKRCDKNNPYHKSKINMVLLKEKENLPILIRVFASGILINAKLIETK